MQEVLTKKRRTLILLLTIAILVAAILVTSSYAIRLDLSSDGVNSLSDPSRNLYKSINEQVQISYYISSTLSDKHSGPKAIENMLRSFAAHSKGKIRVEVIDPVKSKKEDLANSLGLTAQQMQIIDKNEQRVALVYSGIVIQHLNKSEVLPFVLGTETLEYDIVRSIRNTLEEKKQNVAVLLGDINKQWQENYKIVADALKRTGWNATPIKPGDEVPPDSNALLVIGNMLLENFDVYQIDRYLAGGGKAFFAIKGVNVLIEQGLIASPLSSNPLLVALESYGVKVEPQLVLDKSMQTAPFSQASPFGGGVMINYLPYPHWIITRREYSNNKNPLTTRSSGLDLFWPSPITLKPISGVDSQVLVQTTPESWLQKEKILIDPKDETQFAAESATTKGQYTVVASLSGVFPQAFRDKPKPSRAGVALPDLPTQSRSARVIVVSSSDFASDLMSITQSEFNGQFITNALDYLAASPDLVAIKSRSARDTRLNKIQDPVLKAGFITGSYLLNIGIIPLAVSIIVLLRLLRRRRLAYNEATRRQRAKDVDGTPPPTRTTIN